MSSDSNPFVGPKALGADDQIFGRTKEIRELLQLVRSRRIVLLHSPSGAGKSSLLHAGLIPQLVENEIDVWSTIRLNLDPSDVHDLPAGVNRYVLSTLVSLEAELPEGKRRPPRELATLTLAECLGQRPRRPRRQGWPIALVFDQFEEVLTAAPLAMDEKRAFFQSLAVALSDEGVYALFAMREDHLGALAPYRAYLPTRLSNAYRLDLLSREAAEEAATELVRRGDRSFPAVRALIDDLARVQVQQPDGSTQAVDGIFVEPVQLQVVGRRMWDALPEGDRTVDLADLKQYGKVNTALADYYADAVARLARGDLKVERAIRVWVGTKLINNGVRVQIRRAPERSAGLDNALIEGLLNSYLVRAEPRLGADHYELSHDRLVRPVLEDNARWDRESLHFVQRQAEAWEKEKRPENLLLRPDALIAAERWAQDNPHLITKEEQDYLAASRELRDWEAAEERKERRRRLIMAGLLGVSVVSGLVGYGLYYRTLQTKALAVAATMEAKAATSKARDLARMAAAYAAAYDPTTQTLMLRDVEHPETTLRWRQAATEVLGQPVSLTVLRDHQAAVRQVAFSADGARLFTVADDGKARVWSTTGEGAAVVVPGPKGRLVTALSPDGSRVAVGLDDGSTRIASAQDGWEPRALVADGGAAVTALAFSPDGQTLATGTRSGVVRLWPMAGGEPVAQVFGKLPIRALAFTPDGQTLVVGGEDGGVWRGGVSAPLGAPRPVAQHAGPVSRIALSRDGARVLSVSSSLIVLVSSLVGEGPELPLAGHAATVNCGALSPDGRHALTGSDDYSARIWTLDGSPTSVALLGHRAAITDCAFSADGSRVLTASEDGTARVWGLDGGLQLELYGHGGAVLAASFSPDGREVLTGSSDGTARRWSIEVPNATATLRGHTNEVWAATWSRDGQRVVTAAQDGTARVWDRAGGGEPVVLDHGGARLHWAELSPDGRHVVTGGLDDAVWIWPADGQGEPRKIGVSSAVVTSVSYSPDSKRIAATSGDGKVRILDADGVLLRETGPLAKGGVSSATWSPQGDRLVVAFANSAQIWPADLSEPIITLDGHTKKVRYAAFSPDGTKVVTASLDGTARVWSADGAGAPVVLSGHASGLFSAAFSPDGTQVVTASQDGTARVWSADGQGDPLVLRGHQGEVNSAFFSPDGRQVLTSSDDHTARVWSVPSIEAMKDQLWRATPLCLDGQEYQRWLGLNEDEAKEAVARCQSMVAERQAGASGG